MVQASPIHSSGARIGTNSCKRPAFCSFAAVSMIVNRCAKQVSRASKKFFKSTKSSSSHEPSPTRFPADKIPVKSSPSKLMESMRNIKMSPFGREKVEKESSQDFSDGEFGNGGVWQKSIMMGGKCQPHDFSGVIYYDSNGKQISDLPARSPRASPLHGYNTRDMF